MDIGQGPSRPATVSLDEVPVRVPQPTVEKSFRLSPVAPHHQVEQKLMLFLHRRIKIVKAQKAWLVRNLLSESETPMGNDAAIVFFAQDRQSTGPEVVANVGVVRDSDENLSHLRLRLSRNAGEPDHVCQKNQGRLGIAADFLTHRELRVLVQL